MTNRREILQAALAAAAVLPGFKALAAAPGSMPLYKVLYDPRTPAGLAFAASAKRSGSPLHATRGDVTDVWFNELQPQWRQHRTATAGLTDFHSLFVLDMMARDAGMRAVYIATHRLCGRDRFEHRLFGPHELVRQSSLVTDGYDWASTAAGIVTGFAGEVSVAAQHSSIADARNIELTAHDLVSWVIASPRRDIYI
jgi:hypothetical protein